MLKDDETWLLGLGEEASHAICDGFGGIRAPIECAAMTFDC